jgi:hypothetical protein
VSLEILLGVNQFRFGPFELHFGIDKLVILDSRENDGRHLTIHFGGKSGIVDAHITEPAAKSHRTLGGIAQSDLESLLSSVGPRAEGYFLELMGRILRPVRFGWLEHRGLLTFPPTLYEPEGLLTLGERRGKRWDFDRVRLEEFFRHNLRRADLMLQPDAAYVLYLRRRRSLDPYGMLLKFTDDHGCLRFFWFRFSNLLGELDKLWRIHSPHILSLLKLPDEVAAAIQERTNPQ